MTLEQVARAPLSSDPFASMASDALEHYLCVARPGEQARYINRLLGGTEARHEDLEVIRRTIEAPGFLFNAG